MNDDDDDDDDDDRDDDADADADADAEVRFPDIAGEHCIGSILPEEKRATTRANAHNQMHTIKL